MKYIFKMVKSVVNGTVTYYVGAHFEVSAGVVSKYYFAGSQRIAMRVNGTLSFIFGDHLGSTSLTATVATDGSITTAEMRYRAWGEVRYSSGSLPTKYTYTGQRSFTAEIGLMFYNARWYDPALSRFTSADSIVPPGVQGLDRYAYANNSPLVYSDPTGHCVIEGHQMDNSMPACQALSGGSGGSGGIIDPVLLTHAGDKAITEDGKPYTVTYGGADAYELYRDYQKTCGWWNNGCTTSFGYQEFLGMWILFESNGNPKIANVISTLVAQNLYVGGNRPATCNSQTCFNGMFNFIASYSQGRGGLFSGPAANKIYVKHRPNLGGEADTRRLILSLGSNALNPSSVILWDRYNGPSNWGNVNNWGLTLSEYQIPASKVNGTAPNTVYYYVNNAIFYSINQKKYWEALGVDMTMAEEGETIP